MERAEDEIDIKRGGDSAANCWLRPIIWRHCGLPFPTDAMQYIWDWKNSVPGHIQNKLYYRLSGGGDSLRSPAGCENICDHEHYRFEDEICDMRQQLDALNGIGVDGIIVQDLAVFDYVAANFADMEVHCSTQMGVDILEVRCCSRNGC